MDKYVSDFPATHHGYRMWIGNSQKKSSAVSHYECYRSGYPSGRSALIGTTKSARIGYPFKLDTRYLYHSSSWILIHTHLGHNHLPDPQVKPHKKHKDPNAGPILAPGVVLDEDTGSTSLEPANVITHMNSKIETHMTPEGAKPLTTTTKFLKTQVQPTLTATPRGTTHPLINENIRQPDQDLGPLSKTLKCTPPRHRYYDIEAKLNTLDSLESTLSMLRAQLCAMAPHRRQAVLTKLHTIIRNEGMINDECKLPTAFLPEPPAPTLFHDSVNDTLITPHTSPARALQELSVSIDSSRDAV
ncbi:uncharacterized protein MELLADRAFT_105985 [Melampsora larici-populina 98AG31]|uniref:Uncharacterized protein n=1 Tax=Melampsora larici-populina (strain 98AG31 / pathotype 3-4-7) TaxID=747676 RepID=F4RJZ6_MELLP|nr:uncharacterized protein MELLADRAFT_105985 [Melampsora larici-populina 98AG31]EGG07400.1 hypothetical protein MELLADRAFT_105985 [Melampsora larici-populina 98AG31]